MQAAPTKAVVIDPLKSLREFISSGGYSPGDRLPAERELISELGITRNLLRKGLDALEREGVIWRHVGKGTFITAHENNNTANVLASLSHHVTPVQMMRARLSLEPAIAREAAINASAESIRKLVSTRDRALAAKSWDTYETNDDVFHRAVADATGNILLLSLFDHLNQVRRAVAWRQVIRKSDRPGADHPSFLEHNLIVEAIESRDPVAAQEAMHGHLKSVSNRLFGDV